jgi:molybdopterin-guanine dinucleotide biosynthesis protein A
MENVTGIILAGGKSRRMGSDKGLMIINGKPMVQYIIDELESLDIPVIIVSNNPQYEIFGFPVFEDSIKNKGPMAGIYTGLLHSNTEKNVVLSCDVPKISAKLIKQLVSRANNSEVSILKHGDTLHPLIGIYRRSALVDLKNHLDNDRLKMKQFCIDRGCCLLEMSDDNTEFDAEGILNINTKEQLKQLQK